ncbi:MAG: DUF3048 domain-containing protein, partial [Halanaerobiaceae bacterium]
MDMKKKYRWAFILIIIYISLLLIFPGCGLFERTEVSRESGEEEVTEEREEREENGEGEEEDREKVEEEQEEEAETEVGEDSEMYSEEEGEELSRHPFTGSPLEEESFSRAVLAVIDNLDKVRPQDGLLEAPLVYEVLVEGGITRLLALYLEEFPDRIGPIRSARPYMVDIALEYNALLLHAGGSPDGLSRLQEEDIDNLDQMRRGSYYWRSSERSNPHNLYTGDDRIEEFVDELTGQEYRPRFDFQPITIITGDENRAEEISINYWMNYSVNYRYDKDNNNYRRFLNDFKEPHRVTGGQQITADNIIVRYTPAKIKDDEGRIDLDLQGEGKAQIFRDGVVVEARWEKDGDDQTSYFRRGSEEQVDLKPGRTWIQIVPETA